MGTPCCAPIRERSRSSRVSLKENSHDLIKTGRFGDRHACSCRHRLRSVAGAAASDTGESPLLQQPAPEHKSIRIKVPSRIGNEKSSLVFEVVYEGKGKK